MLVAGVLFGNAVAALSTSVHDAFVRRPGAVADGQLWRVVTPLVVQTDGVLVLVGVVGRTAGLAWQPHGGGASLGMCGPFGVIVALMLRPGGGLGPMARLLGAVGLGTAALLTVAQDIHGPALLTGAAIGAVCVARGGRLAPTGIRPVDELLALSGHG